MKTHGGDGSCWCSIERNDDDDGRDEMLLMMVVSATM